ncbi:hypothetical protein [Saccharopolyspora spinosa]|uniref:Uncharacterized protein n=1 Tax=Saccharopolyspora spinosa TaxID=60894 RepID=A0A2N3Y535_SACSN|nr:hypothetical protein [Saccharopolyspora spinosa]PKW18025.1 hypothetical protein A8926_6078 [Saccharopolyspora spinosa]
MVEENEAHLIAAAHSYRPGFRSGVSLVDGFGVGMLLATADTLPTHPTLLGAQIPTRGTTFSNTGTLVHRR